MRKQAHLSREALDTLLINGRSSVKNGDARLPIIVIRVRIIDWTLKGELASTDFSLFTAIVTQTFSPQVEACTVHTRKDSLRERPSVFPSRRQRRGGDSN